MRDSEEGAERKYLSTVTFYPKSVDLWFHTMEAALCQKDTDTT